MGGLILMDRQAKPLSNYLSWRDQRSLTSDTSGAILLEEIRETWKAAGHLTELGQELQPGSTTVLLAWLKRHNLLPVNAVPATIGDYVVAQLVGQCIPMHATQAIGMLNLQTNQWHAEALKQIGLDQLALPELALTERCVGEAQVAGRWLKVYGSYGDQPCALRGAGLQRHELSLNVSTGSQVSRRVASFMPGPYQSRKYFFGDTLDTVTHLPAGRSLNILVDLLSELAVAEGVLLRNPWETIHKKVSALDDTDLQVNLAFFRGPLGERGRIDNISTENLSVGSLFYAAYRAMADNYRQVANRFGSQDWQTVVLSGGLSYHAPQLRTLISDRFAVPLRESSGEETLSGLLDIACESKS